MSSRADEIRANTEFVRAVLPKKDDSIDPFALAMGCSMLVCAGMSVIAALMVAVKVLWTFGKWLFT